MMDRLSWSSCINYSDFFFFCDGSQLKFQNEENIMNDTILTPKRALRCEMRPKKMMSNINLYGLTPLLEYT